MGVMEVMGTKESRGDSHLQHKIRSAIICVHFATAWEKRLLHFWFLDGERHENLFLLANVSHLISPRCVRQRAKKIMYE
jgi:hypothetical protein